MIWSHSGTSVVPLLFISECSCDMGIAANVSYGKQYGTCTWYNQTYIACGIVDAEAFQQSEVACENKFRRLAVFMLFSASLPVFRSVEVSRSR